MSIPRLSKRQKAALAVALALVMWLPNGVSSHEHTMVTGHSTFYNGDTYDPCLGSIAGIMRSRVMWFNDQVLVERYGGKGTYIWATEGGAPDPRTYAYLYTEGVYYDFVDPNGAHWHVEEAWYADNLTVSQSGEVKVPNPGAIGSGGGGVNGGVQTNYSVSPVKPEDKYYVWIVELSAHPIFDDFAGNDPENFHTYYNFVNLVDTCKMHRRAFHDVVNHTIDSGKLTPDYGHPALDKEHDHETWKVNLWVGVKPRTVPFGSVQTAPDSWDDSWAAQYPEQQASGAGVSPQTNNGPNNGSPSYWEDP